MDLMDIVDNMDDLTFLSLFCPPGLKRHKKTGTEEIPPFRYFMAQGKIIFSCDAAV